MHVTVKRPAALDDETLDPEDWAETASLAHRIVDETFAGLRNVRKRPVWQEMPVKVASHFATPLPREGEPLEDVYDELLRNLMPYPMGNVHPRFWAWYMGAGNVAGALGDFLAAMQGSNVGGGRHAAALMDQQVVNWCKEMVGFPADASGTLITGGSVANLIGLTVGRNVKAGIDVRELGVAAMPRPLRFYGSDQIHSCHRKAVEALGLGNSALVRIPSDDDFTLSVPALRAAIAADRAAGFEPACIIANAGAVNTGAIDDLQALADLAARENMWLHVDGCIGAMLAISPTHHHLIAGIERADSLALDLHKWLHAPFDIGCALVKDAVAHRGAFATTPEYLESSPRGLASGQWLHEFGPQTSRGFRALKVWMALKQHGAKKFGRLIDQNIEQAHYLAEQVNAHPELRLMAPAPLNIVCFRFDPGGLSEDELKALNVEIMLRLQEEGTAVLSDTTIRDRHCLRAAICNHRTRVPDIDILVDEVLRLGRDIAAGH